MNFKGMGRLIYELEMLDQMKQCRTNPSAGAIKSLEQDIERHAETVRERILRVAFATLRDIREERRARELGADRNIFRD